MKQSEFNSRRHPAYNRWPVEQPEQTGKRPAAMTAEQAGVRKGRTGTRRPPVEARRERPKMQTGPMDPRIMEEQRRRQEKKKKTIYFLFTAFCALMIILMAVVLRSVSDTRAFNGYMEQAKTYYYAGDFESTLTYLRKAAGIDATEECLAMTAQCYEALGNYDKALETLRRMDVSDPQVSNWIGDLERRKAVISQFDQVTVGSRQYKSDTTGIALDNMGLDNRVIGEVLQLYALDNLSLAGNHISDITGLEQLGGLVTLNLSDNAITDISVLGTLTGLRTLYLDYNPITDLSPLNRLVNLTTLSIKGIPLTESQLKALTAALPGCAIHSETVEKEEQDISFGGITFKTDVTELNLSGLGIQNISALAGCKQLQRLDISNNLISDLSPLMDLPHLQWLNVSGNNVTDLRPLMGMGSLQYLDVSYNQFTSTVALGNMTGLTELHLSGNRVNELGALRKLNKLSALEIVDCDLRDEMLLPLMELTGLRVLNLENNPQLSGEAVDLLKSNLYTCQVRHSELSYMANIDGYTIRNDGSNIDLSGLNIVDISNFKKFLNPETVNLSQNNINNLYPLMEAPNRLLVKHLNLSYNALSDLTPLSGLLNLETLDLSYNMMITSELPLLGLTRLRELNVTGTMLSDQQIMILKNSLPGCNVISSYGY